jgi:hypothetical protein
MKDILFLKILEKDLRTFDTTKLFKGITLNSLYKTPNTGLNIGEKVKNTLKFSPSSTDGFNLYEESSDSIKLRQDPRKGT